MRYRKRKSDEVWHVNAEELHFDHPVEVVGQGAFGVVLLAEYRGTKVAIKRVLPKKEGKKRSGSIASIGSGSGPKDSEEMAQTDIETGDVGVDTTTASGTASAFKDLDFLGGYSFGARKGRFRRLFGGRSKDDTSRYNLSILGSVSAGAMSRSVFGRFFPACDDTSRRHEEFKEEMRLLSRLRHPCITTVMGAVMNGIEPVSITWL